MTDPVGVDSPHDFPHRFIFSIYYAQVLDKFFTLNRPNPSAHYASWKDILKQVTSLAQDPSAPRKRI
jgi:hypothetical protein